MVYTDTLCNGKSELIVFPSPFLYNDFTKSLEVTWKKSSLVAFWGAATTYVSACSLMGFHSIWFHMDRL